MKRKKENISVDRRAFLNALGASAGVAASLPAISILSGSRVYASDIGPQGGRARAELSESFRVSVADRESNVPIPNHDDHTEVALNEELQKAALRAG